MLSQIIPLIQKYELENQCNIFDSINKQLAFGQY